MFLKSISLLQPTLVRLIGSLSHILMPHMCGDLQLNEGICSACGKRQTVYSLDTPTIQRNNIHVVCVLCVCVCVRYTNYLLKGLIVLDCYSKIETRCGWLYRFMQPQCGYIFTNFSSELMVSELALLFPCCSFCFITSETRQHGGTVGSRTARRS